MSGRIGAFLLVAGLLALAGWYAFRRLASPMAMLGEPEGWESEPDGRGIEGTVPDVPLTPWRTNVIAAARTYGLTVRQAAGETVWTGSRTAVSDANRLEEMSRYATRAVLAAETFRLGFKLPPSTVPARGRVADALTAFSNAVTAPDSPAYTRDMPRTDVVARF